VNNLLIYICSKEYFMFTSVIKTISTACRMGFNWVVNNWTNSYQSLLGVNNLLIYICSKEYFSICGCAARLIIGLGRLGRLRSLCPKGKSFKTWKIRKVKHRSYKKHSNKTMPHCQSCELSCRIQNPGL
jgi:hypothetical protein